MFLSRPWPRGTVPCLPPSSAAARAAEPPCFLRPGLSGNRRLPVFPADPGLTGTGKTGNVMRRVGVRF